MPSEDLESGKDSRSAETSTEFRGMLVYHFTMMALMITPVSGFIVSAPVQVGIAAMIGASIALVSIRRRSLLHWHWRGAGPLQYGRFAMALVGGAVLFFVVFPLVPPTKPQALPWYLAGIGIVTFNALQALRIVHSNEAAFLAECGDAQPEVGPIVTPSTDASWVRVTRVAFGVVATLVWLSFMGFFYFDTRAMRDGSPTPTATQTIAWSEKGQTRYITPAEHDRVGLLKTVSMVGIPAVIGLALLLERVLGVRLRGR